MPMRILAYMIAALAVHESAHAIAALSRGLRVKKVGVCRRGVYVLRSAGTELDSLLIALAGPLANVTLALVCTGTMSLVNWALALGNLLPFGESDGAHALRSARALWVRA